MDKRWYANRCLPWLEAHGDALPTTFEEIQPFIKMTLYDVVAGLICLLLKYSFLGQIYQPHRQRLSAKNREIDHYIIGRIEGVDKVTIPDINPNLLPDVIVEILQHAMSLDEIPRKPKEKSKKLGKTERVLGKGAFGAVVLEETPEGTFVLKQPKLDRYKYPNKYKNAMRSIAREAMALQRLQGHDRPDSIPIFIGYDKTRGELRTRYNDTFDLETAFGLRGTHFPGDPEPQSLTQELVLALMDSIMGALTFLYKRGVCHEDIRLSNIVVNKTFQGRQTHFGLIDFGVAEFLELDLSIADYFEKVKDDLRGLASAVENLVKNAAVAGRQPKVNDDGRKLPGFDTRLNDFLDKMEECNALDLMDAWLNGSEAPISDEWKRLPEKAWYDYQSAALLMKHDDEIELVSVNFELDRKRKSSIIRDVGGKKIAKELSSSCLA
jgi:serine/threonine protein kinase